LQKNVSVVFFYFSTKLGYADILLKMAVYARWLTSWNSYYDYRFLSTAIFSH